MAEPKRNRNNLILGILAAATVVAFLVIYFLDQRPANTGPVSEVEELVGEIQDLESSILELEYVYQEQDNELEMMEALIKEKNLRLAEMEEKVEELQEQGKLDAEQVNELKERLVRLRVAKDGIVETNTRVNTFVEEISMLTRNNDSLRFNNQRLDSLKRAYDAIIKQYKIALKNCNPNAGPIVTPEEIRPRLSIDNLRIYNVARNGGKQEIQRDIRAKELNELEFNFDVSGNKLVNAGEKDIYVIIRPKRGNAGPLTNASIGAGTFIYKGREQAYSLAVRTAYQPGSSNKNRITYTQDKFPAGLYTVEFIYKDEVLKNRTLFLQ